MRPRHQVNVRVQLACNRSVGVEARVRGGRTARRLRLIFSTRCSWLVRLSDHLVLVSMSAALVARVVATTNRPPPESFTLRSTVTLYRIHVRQFADSTKSWCVLRRYSEFVELHEVLTRTIGTLPPLPPKLVLNTAESLADRYLELDAFLRSLLAMPPAAAHVRLRSFLGADGANAPHPFGSRPGSPTLSRPGSEYDRDTNGEPTLRSIGATGSSPPALLVGRSTRAASSPAAASAPIAEVEDDWEVEADESADEAPDEIADGASPPRSPVAGSRGSSWLLTGEWLADEARSHDTLEPMMRAMGTPWAARRMLRGVAITSMLTHEPGIRLHELATSSLGAGKPACFELDGAARPLWIGRKEGSVRAVELRGTGAVRLEFTLPDAKGVVRDTRRVLAGGDELERIIELRLAKQPPLRIHRLLIRQANGPRATPRPATTMGDTAAAVNAALRDSQPPPDAAAAPLAPAAASAADAPMPAMPADVPPSAAARQPQRAPPPAIAHGAQGAQRPSAAETHALARRPPRPRPARKAHVYRHERGILLVKPIVDGILAGPTVTLRLARAAPVTMLVLVGVLGLHLWYATLEAGDGSELIVAIAAVGGASHEVSAPSEASPLAEDDALAASRLPTTGADAEPDEVALASPVGAALTAAMPVVPMALVTQLPARTLLAILDTLLLIALIGAALRRERGAPAPQSQIPPAIPLPQVPQGQAARVSV